jgi:hypothetical protein
VQILKEVCEYEFCPLRVKYFASIHFLEITSAIQQQLSRFIVYKFACREVIAITNRGAASQLKRGELREKKVNGLQGTNIILNIFHYSWFINRVKNESDLFRYEFLIALLHAYFTTGSPAAVGNKAELKDLLDLCHFLLDWNYSSKEDTFIPTIKFAIDMYL